MDILAHALYGVTLFSRSGLAGGRKGWSARCRSSMRDWTLWAAAGFGILPDMTSIGVYFSHMWIQGDSPSFHALPSYVFLLYHCTHSLMFAGLMLLVLRLIARPLVIPALKLALPWAQLVAKSGAHDALLGPPADIVDCYYGMAASAKSLEIWNGLQ